jgi:hypothetical protein
VSGHFLELLNDLDRKGVNADVKDGPLRHYEGAPRAPKIEDAKVVIRDELPEEGNFDPRVVVQRTPQWQSETS